MILYVSEQDVNVNDVEDDRAAQRKWEVGMRGGIEKGVAQARHETTIPTM